MVRALAGVIAVLAVGQPALADETSTGDKLRTLYSNRFNFTDEGVPLITVEIMGNQREVRLRDRGGLRVRPDGSGGAAIDSGDDAGWVITAENTSPALIQEWTVVESLGPDDTAGITAAAERWQKRGLQVRAFEIGTIFGVDGEVIDTREVQIAVDPVNAGAGAERAATLAQRFSVKTSVHAELVRRPSGTIVARSGTTTVRNPSVLWFEPRQPGSTITVDKVEVGGGGSQLETSLEDRSYWGSIYVTVDRKGALVVVNAVPENKLLAGLVPAEIFPDAPDAALEAQAIAARTELLEKIGRRNLTDPFLLCSTQQCQVYAGAGKEHPRTTRAVEKTRGMVALRSGGGLVDARYSASCGGHSEDNDAIWGGEPDPSLRGRVDGKKAMSRIDDRTLDGFLSADAETFWCGKTKAGKARLRWSARLDAVELAQRLASEAPAVGRPVRLEPLARGISGRIRELRIHGERGTVEIRGDLRIRRLLGGLRSTLFTVRSEGPVTAPTAFVFRGAGFGHGVGMCQMGAIGMAEAGHSHAEILAHYYRGAHVHRLY
jgi:SpoIID/LytB domain protein